MNLQQASSATAPSEDSPEAERAGAVSRLFREHNRVLVGFLAARLQNEHEAQEVAQEAYVKLLQLERTGAVSFLRAYLFRVAENLAVDRLRHRGCQVRHEQIESLEECLDHSPLENEAAARQELDVLQQALGELPSNCARAFRMHRLEERPQAEVATVLGVTERMVRKYITQALIYTRLRLDGLSAESARARLRP